MNTSRRKEIIERSIRHYGHDKQLNKAIEELAELTVELAKYKSGYLNKKDIISEVADVYNVLELVRIIVDIDPKELDQEIAFKVDRLNHRMITGYDPNNK